MERQRQRCPHYTCNRDLCHQLFIHQSFRKSGDLDTKALLEIDLSFNTVTYLKCVHLGAKMQDRKQGKITFDNLLPVMDGRLACITDTGYSFIMFHLFSLLPSSLSVPLLWSLPREAFKLQAVPGLQGLGLFPSPLL